MNFHTVLISSLASFAVVLLPIMLICAAVQLYLPVLKGWVGERRVRKVLDAMGPAYTRFHNVLLPIDGETTQIDHIVFAGGKCFVIETKAYSGWIFGTASDSTWTQTFNKRSRYSFQNPIRQNYKHILAVKSLIGDVTVVGVIVFTRGTFQSGRIENVLHIKELKDYLLQNTPSDSVNDDASVRSLANAMMTERGAYRKHVRGLQEKYGGRWKAQLAHSFLLVACCVFVFRAQIVHFATGSTPADPSYAHARVPLSALMPAGNIRYHPSDVQNEYQKPTAVLPVVNGLTKGKAIVFEAGKYRVLAIGDVTKDGWRLLAADATSATFLHSSGQKATIRIR